MNDEWETWLGEPYVSNCIIAGILAKLRNWGGVRLGVHIDRKKKRIHVFWFEGGEYHDFCEWGDSAQMEDGKCHLLFRGKERIISNAAYERWRQTTCA